MKNSFLAFSIALCIFFNQLVLAQPATKMDGFNASSYAAKINGKLVGKRQAIISSAFNPKDFQCDIHWSGRISQYDWCTKVLLLILFRRGVQGQKRVERWYDF